MPENKKIIQAYIGNEILHKAFSPSGQKEINNWIYQYKKDFYGFLEIGCHDLNSNYMPTESISFEYKIDSIDKFTFEFIHCDNQLWWKQDIDKEFFYFPIQDFLTECNKRNQAITNYENDDLKAVVDSMICHPYVHQHIIMPEYNHNIRIGSGLDNPFLLLYNLRFQLSPIAKRDEERNRIINLFDNSLNNKFQDFSYNKLFLI